eukprot:Platyproteum_vivax@DN12450_c0_g1_i1.p1
MIERLDWIEQRKKEKKQAKRREAEERDKTEKTKQTDGDTDGDGDSVKLFDSSEVLPVILPGSLEIQTSETGETPETRETGETETPVPETDREKKIILHFKVLDVRSKTTYRESHIFGSLWVNWNNSKTMQQVISSIREESELAEEMGDRLCWLVVNDNGRVDAAMFGLVSRLVSNHVTGVCALRGGYQEYLGFVQKLSLLQETPHLIANAKRKDRRSATANPAVAKAAQTAALSNELDAKTPPMEARKGWASRLANLASTTIRSPPSTRRDPRKQTERQETGRQETGRQETETKTDTPPDRQGRDEEVKPSGSARWSSWSRK